MSTNLGDYLRSRMAELHVTQVELARRAGVSRQGLVKLLNGEIASPAAETIRSIAVVLNVSPIYLYRILFRKSLVDREIANASQVPRDHSSFVADATFPNGTLVPPGHRFEKAWDIQNSGDVVWERRTLRCVGFDADVMLPGEIASKTMLVPDCAAIPVPVVKPGSVVRLTVTLTAPTLPGTCISEWKLYGSDGQPSFPALDALNCVVVVSTI